nr:hypothetical protein [Actinomycetota bacterium]
MSREGTAGDLAIVLHSHMPYVEGFGTYPFGEEWLFDAVIRSYLPVLEVARDLTMTVTPVLADQLEDAAAAERLRRLKEEHPGALLLDAGDAVSAGNLGFRPGGEPVLEAMTELGYAAMCLGNRETHPRKEIFPYKID